VAAKGDRWVCLDVGETLIDESRVWETWAQILGVTRFTFMAAMGAMLARGRQFDEVFEFLGVTNRDEHRAAFNATYGGFQESDLYPDAKPALDALRVAGYRVAIIANQPAERTEELRFLGVRAEVMGMSTEALGLGYAGRVDEALAALVGVDRSGLAPSIEGWLDYSAGEVVLDGDPAVALAALGRALVLAEAGRNRFLAGVARVSASRTGPDGGPPAVAGADAARSTTTSALA